MRNFFKAYKFIWVNLFTKTFNPIDAHLLLYIIRFSYEEKSYIHYGYKPTSRTIGFTKSNIKKSYEKLNQLGYIKSTYSDSKRKHFVELTIDPGLSFQKFPNKVFDKLDTKEVLTLGFIKTWMYKIRKDYRSDCFEKYRIALGINMGLTSVFEAEKTLVKLDLISNKTIWTAKNKKKSIIRLTKKQKKTKQITQPQQIQQIIQPQPQQITIEQILEQQRITNASNEEYLKQIQ